MDVVLVDAKNATYRHGWTRSSLHNSAGQPTGAIFGILSCLLRLYKFHPKAQFIFCWDGKDTYKSWRHKVCGTYKANRSKPGSKDVPVEVKDILSQIPAIKKVIDILGFPQYEVERLEADDLIGILAKYVARKSGVENVFIYSMDKDMHQLIGGKIAVVKDLNKSLKCRAYTSKDVLADFGVTPKDWNKYRALVGDSSDGIKSPFPKIGKVRAMKLLAEGLDASKSAPSTEIERQFSEHWSKAHMNYRLSKIVTNAESKVMTSVNRLHLIKVVEAVSTVAGIKRRQIENTDARKFVKFCATYELQWIMENRHLFYSIGG